MAPVHPHRGQVAPSLWLMKYGASWGTAVIRERGRWKPSPFRGGRHHFGLVILRLFPSALQHPPKIQK